MNFFRRVLASISIVLLLFGILRSPITTRAQEKSSSSMVTIEARVERIVEEKEITLEDSKQLYQRLELRLQTPSKEKIIVENGSIPIANVIRFREGDEVIVTKGVNPEGKEVYYITDVVRRRPLYALFALFILLVVVVAKQRGVLSIVGMVLSFAVVFYYMLPQIKSGQDPIFTVFCATALIAPVTFVLSHGFNKKTAVAIGSTMITLLITSLLAQYFIGAVRLTGFASEEAGFLETVSPNTINMVGLLLAGIIIGTLGILDDITISQAAIAYQLHDAQPKISFGELYHRTMEVGKDHIASLVNTLILVYTGAALPLFLLFSESGRSFGEVVNYEMIAEEIVRTLVSSIGLILAVPITTLIACLLLKKD